MIGRYWNNSAAFLSQLENAIVACTLKRHMVALLRSESSGFMFLLMTEQYDDLKRMFLSFCRVADSAGVSEMAQIFREYIHRKKGQRKYSFSL